MRTLMFKKSAIASRMNLTSSPLALGLLVTSHGSSVVPAMMWPWKGSIKTTRPSCTPEAAGTLKHLFFTFIFSHMIYPTLTNNIDEFGWLWSCMCGVCTQKRPCQVVSIQLWAALSTGWQRALPHCPQVGNGPCQRQHPETRQLHSNMVLASAMLRIRATRHMDIWLPCHMSKTEQTLSQGCLRLSDHLSKSSFRQCQCKYMPASQIWMLTGTQGPKGMLSPGHTYTQEVVQGSLHC